MLEATESEVTSVVRERFPALLRVWNHLGLPEDMAGERRRGFVSHIRGLIDSMVEEEEKMERKMFQGIEKLEKNTQELIAGLGELSAEESASTPPPPPGETPLEKDKRLKTSNKSLEEIKKKREEETFSLIKICADLAIELEEQSHEMLEIDFHGRVPQRIEIDVLKNHADEMKEEKARRIAVCSQMQSRIRKDLEEIGESHEDSFMADVSLSGKGNVTKKYINKLKEAEEGLELIKRERIAESSRLREQIEKLWDLMGIAEEKRDEFRSETKNLSRDTIDALKAKLEGLRATRRGMLEELVLKTAHDIREAHKQARLPEPLIDPTCPASEQLLEELVKRLDDAKRICEKRRPILASVDEWERKLRRLQELEDNARDPSRLKNRGGRLLMEEKERKMLFKKLPKITSALMNEVEEWKKTEGEFLIDGMTVDEYKEAILAGASKKQEEVVSERQKKRKLETENEMRFGSINPNKNKKPKTVPFKVRLDPPNERNSSVASTSQSSHDVSQKSLNEVQMTPWGTMKYSPNKPPSGQKFKSEAKLARKERGSGGIGTAIRKCSAKFFGKNTARTTDNLKLPGSAPLRGLRRRSKSWSDLGQTAGNSSRALLRGSRLPIPSAGGTFFPSVQTPASQGRGGQFSLHGMTQFAEVSMLPALSETIECWPAKTEEGMNDERDQDSSQDAFFKDLIGGDRPVNARSSIIPSSRFNIT